MPVSAGVAYIDILPRLTKFQAALSTGMGRIAGRLDTVGNKLTKTLALPLAIIGGAAVKLATDFEESLAKIEGLVGIPADEVHRLGQELLKLAPLVGKTPRELAESLYFVTSAGFKSAEALEVVRVAARAASAGLGDTQEIADVLSSAINAYGHANLTAARASDILVATVREGKAEAPELARAIGKVIPVAAQVGVEFDEVGAAIASMTRTGFNAREAVTSLRQFMVLLLKPAAQSRKALEGLGLTQADVALLTKRLNLELAKGGFSIERLRDIVAKQGLYEGMIALKTALRGNFDALGNVIPNVRALAGFLSIVGPNAKENADVFKTLAGSVGDTDKAFAVAAQTMKFKMQRNLAALQTTGIRLGQVLLPIVKRAADALLAMVERFDRLSPAVKENIAKFLLFAAVLGPIVKLFAATFRTILYLVDGIGLLIRLIKFLRIVFIAVRIWLAGASISLGPWLVLAAAIGAIIFLLVKYRKEFVAGLKVIGAFFVRTWRKVARFFSDVWEGMLDGWRTFVAGLKRFFTPIVRPIIAAVKVIAAIVGFYAKVWINIFKASWYVISNVVKVAFNVIVAIIKLAFAVIKPFIEFGLNLILFVFKTIWALITGVIRTAWELITLIIRTAVNLLRPVVEPVFNALKSVITTVWNAIVSVTRTVWNTVKTVVTTVWNAIKAAASTVWSAIRTVIINPAKAAFDFVKNGLNTLKTTWSRVWGTFAGIAQKIWDGIKSVVRTGVNAIIKFINGVITGLNKMVNALDSALGPFINLPDIPKLSLIPELDTGGTVLETGIAVVHKGENVVPPGSAMAAPAGNVYITVEGSVITERDLVTRIREALMKTKRRNSSLGLA